MTEEEGVLPPPMGPTSVVWFTSTNGRDWVRQSEKLTDKFQSLGLSVRADGSLWLSGLDQSGLATPEEQALGPRPEGFIGRDGVWERTTWADVHDPDALQYIDPQWFGDELWYLSRKMGGDPKLGGGKNEIRSIAPGAPGATIHYSEAGIADPSPVTFQGQRYVFLTGQPSGIVQMGSDPLKEIQRWPAVTVPFALTVEDELWLLGQHNVHGKRQPVVIKSRDGRTWSGQFEPMLPSESVGNCTSPVMGPWLDGWVLLCVDEDA